MFINDLEKELNTTTTENGAETLKSTTNPLVDFFALAGATRGNPTLGLDLFKKAFAFDRNGAIKILFYFRDIRGGQGERQLFRSALEYIGLHEKDIAEKIAKHVPEYGRYDDLFSLPLNVVIPIIDEQLAKDNVSEKPSLLAKWLPSENTSSETTRNLAKQVRESLNLGQREYRKLLSKLRASIKLVEQQLSGKQFGEIAYDKVPSQASLKYRKAFYRNDAERYEAFVNQVKSGEKTINASTLYPYQVYEAVEKGDNLASEALWASLPDYTQGKNALVVADVSGSMSGRPMSVSVSLALYFAERNKGQFKDYFITFSDEPQLQKVRGTSLRDKMNSIERSEWEMNTNLQAVFDAILDTATRDNTSADELPSTIYIVSDMEFDNCVHGTNLGGIQKKYKTAGYELPNIVFWNVDARNKQVAADADTKGVTLISGYSPSAFKEAVEGKTALDLVMDIVNSERYAPIVI